MKLLNNDLVDSFHMTALKDRCWFCALCLSAVVITAGRYWYGTKLGLAPDEAYYWRWAQNLSLSYLDHPPLIAVLIHLGESFQGNTVMGIRLPMIIISFFAIGITYKTGRLLGLDRPYAYFAAALATLLPAPATGALLATPDTPLGLCWMISLMALVGLQRSPAPGYWYLLGVSLGFGVLAKHSGMLILFTIAFTLMAKGRIREDLRSLHPWAGIALGFALMLPYLAGELANGLPSFRFQFFHLTGRLSPGTDIGGPLVVLERLGGLLGGQLGLITPPVALLLWKSVRTSEMDTYFRGAVLSNDSKMASKWPLIVGFFIPLLATCLSSFTVHPEQNWASLGHPAAALLAVSAIYDMRENRQERRGKRQSVWLGATLGTAVIVATVIHLHAVYPFLPLPAQRDPVSRLHGWQHLDELKNGAKEVDAIVCDNYGLAAQVSWQFRDIGLNIPIVSVDRDKLPAKGLWLLLDQKGEFGNTELGLKCDEIKETTKVLLKRRGGTVWSVIEVTRGTGCAEES